MQNKDYNEIFTRLTYLTKRNNITDTELAEILNMTRAGMSGRAERNSKFKPEEIKALERAFNVNLSHVNITSNTLSLIKEENKPKGTIGQRLKIVQDELGFLDKAMARLMNIDEGRYKEIKADKKEATLDEVLTLSNNIDVSLDWLIRG